MYWWHLHSEREDAAFHLTTAEPNPTSVCKAELLANYKSQTDPLVIHLVYILEFPEFFEEQLLVFFAYADT